MSRQSQFQNQRNSTSRRGASTGNYDNQYNGYQQHGRDVTHDYSANSPTSSSYDTDRNQQYGRQDYDASRSQYLDMGRPEHLAVDQDMRHQGMASETAWGMGSSDAQLGTSQYGNGLNQYGTQSGAQYDRQAQWGSINPAYSQSQYGGREQGQQQYGGQQSTPRYGNQAGQQYGHQQSAGQYGQSANQSSSGYGPAYGQSFGQSSYDKHEQERQNRWTNASSNGYSGTQLGSQSGSLYGNQYGSSLNQPGQYGQSQAQQQFAGRGPKGYKRSDERIREDVCEALSQHGSVDASDVEVTVDNGTVTLSGQVESRQMKRMIEDSIEHLSGVQDIKNEVKVKSSTSSSDKSSAADKSATRSTDTDSISNSSFASSDKRSGNGSSKNSSSTTRM